MSEQNEQTIFEIFKQAMTKTVQDLQSIVRDGTVNAETRLEAASLEMKALAILAQLEADE
jgi:hypothetical protein